MNCFTVEVLQPSGTILEIESCTGQVTNNLTIEQTTGNNLSISQCMAQLPSDINNTIISQINNHLVAGSGINIIANAEELIISTSDNYSIVGHNHTISDIIGLQNELNNKQPSGNYAPLVHSHLASDITNFNSSVSGLLPVKNIGAGSGIRIVSSSGNFVVSVTGTFGLTGEQVDDRVSQLLDPGSYINLNYNDSLDSLTISVTGLQPSGNYSIVGHNHTSVDITDFSLAVSGLLPNSYDSAVPWTANHTLVDGTRYLANDLVYENGRLYKANYDNESIPVSNTLYWTDIGPGYRLNIDGRDIPNIPYPVTNLTAGSGIGINNVDTDYIISVTGTFGLTGEEVDDRVSNLLTAGNYINLNYSDSLDSLTISVTGLQPSGNYSIDGHTHTASNITDFNSSVSGLLPVKNITAGSGIGISNTSGDYTISVTGTFGLTGEEVDDRVSGLLVAGNYINLNYNDLANTLTVSTTGLQPSGNYSLVGHNHVYTDITNWASGIDSVVSTLLLAGTGIALIEDTLNDTLTIATTGVSYSGHTHTSSEITNFNSSVSGLLTPYALLNSPNFSGVPTVPTASSGTNSNQIASTAFVRTEISNLVDSAPSTLDTLNELASALGDDPNFATTVTNLIAGKVSKSGDIMTGVLQAPSVSLSSGIKIGEWISTIDINENIFGIYSHYDTSLFSESVLTLGAGSSLNINGYADISFTTSSGEVVSWNGNTLSVEGHTHTSSDITNFNSSVSGLLPVKDIVAGNDISVTSISGIYTINSTTTSVDEADSLVTTVFNKTGSTIPKMSVVYINGGQGDMPTVTLAIANSEATSSKTYGVTAEAIDHMSMGKVVVEGSLTGLDTDQFNASAPMGDVNGTVVYLSPSVSGAITTTKPYAPDHLVSVGTIVRTHQNEGVIEVRIQNGFELQELHNVAVTGVTNGQFLQYNSGSGLWIPSSSGNFTTLNVNGTGVSLNGHTHSSSEITDFNSSVSGLLPNNIVTGVGSSGYLTKWVGSNSVSSGLIYDNGTNVGIGTTSPSGKLHIGSGDLYFDSSYGLRWVGGSRLYEQTNLIGGVERMLYMPNGDRFEVLTENGVTFIAGFHGANSLLSNSIRLYRGTLIGNTYSSNTSLSPPSNGLIVEGNVGIGNTSPISKLTIGSGIGSGANSNSTLSYDLALHHGDMIIISPEDSSSNPIYTGISLLVSRPGGFVGGQTSIDFDTRDRGNNFNRGTMARIIGGNTAGTAANQYLGGTLDFQTAPTGSSTPISRMLINRDGNIGIGTTSPTTKLEIDGALKFVNCDSRIVRMDNSSLGVSGVASNVGHFGFYIDNRSTPGGRLYRLASHSDGTTGSFRIRDDNAGVDRLSITSVGNVGIGTTAPSGLLDVAGDVYIRNSANTLGNLYFKSTSAANENSLRVRSDTLGNLYLDAQNASIKVGNQGADVDVYAGGAGPVRIGHVNAGTIANQNIIFRPAGTERMRIDGSGNVGIGTSTPSSRFHVVGSGLFSSITGVVANALLDVYSTVSGEMVFNVEGTNGSLFSVMDNLSGSLMSVNNNAGLPVFEVFSDDRIVGGRFNRNDFVLTSSGNLGVGTATPSGKLHIIGTGIFSEAVLVNNTPVSVSGHAHSASDITNFNSSVSGLFPNNIVTGVGSSGYFTKWTGSNIVSTGIIYDDGTSVGIGTSAPSGLLDVAGNLTFNTFTEKVITNTNSGSGIVLSIDSGTVHRITLTNNCSFTMPSAVAGKSFSMFLNTGSGNYTASFSGVLWSDSAPPTITTTANKVDILSFISDGTSWYGSYSQNYG